MRLRPWRTRGGSCARSSARRRRSEQASRRPALSPSPRATPSRTRRPTRWKSTSAAWATSSSTVPAGMATTDRRPGAIRAFPARVRSAFESVLPRAQFADQRDILGGAGQNVIGLAAGVLATFATQVVMTRVLGNVVFGVVIVTTQFAFIASTATRFGMDVANVRLVAILVGRGEHGRVRALVRKSAFISGAVSLAIGLVVFVLASWLSTQFVSPHLHEEGVHSFWAAALAIPFAAVTWAYLGGTRGLKIMRHTLYIFWIGQPIGWVA